MARDWDPFRLSEALNYHLKPAPVAIRAAERVADDWHARFSAVERRYLFRLLMRRAPATFEAGQMIVESKEMSLPYADHVVGDVRARETCIRDRDGGLFDWYELAADERATAREIRLTQDAHLRYLTSLSPRWPRPVPADSK